MQQIRHAGDQSIYVDGLRVQGLTSREGEEALGQGGRPPRAIQRPFDGFFDPHGVCRCQTAYRIEIAHDDLQQIIEIVRDPARELPNYLHLLRLPQSFLVEFELLRAFDDLLLQICVKLSQRLLAPFPFFNYPKRGMRQVHIAHGNCRLAGERDQAALRPSTEYTYGGMTEKQTAEDTPRSRDARPR